MEGYRKFVKEFGCCVCGKKQVDAHHLDSVGMGNKRKSMIEDYSCVPLCRQHHQEWHQIGDLSFSGKYSINLWKICYQLNKNWRKSEGA
tara:strand:+ start:109 stop:375 length:267 start_codon:yes stop_codon:yes gene_type:complete